MKLIKSCLLHYQAGTSDKQYVVEIFEDNGTYLVQGRYGRVGRALKTVCKAKGTTCLAMQVYDEVVMEKLRKGYTIVGGTQMDDGPRDGLRNPQTPSIDQATAVASVLDRLSNSALPSLGF